jgi:hypothetical protein
MCERAVLTNRPTATLLPPASTVNAAIKSP